MSGIQTQCLNRIPASSLWSLDRWRTLESLRPFDGRKWCHVILTWRLYNPGNPATPPSPACQIYVDGRLSQSILFTQTEPPPAGSSYAGGDPRMCNWCGLDWDRSAGGGYWDDMSETYTLHQPWRDPHLRHQSHFSYHWFWDKLADDNPATQWNPPSGRTVMPDPPPPGGPPNPPLPPAQPDDWVNPLRIGEPTTIAPRNKTGNLVTHNHNPDATVDEFWVWQYVNAAGGLDTNEAAPTGGLIGGQRLWQQGRYYRGNNGAFISQTLDVARSVRRRMPPMFGVTTGTTGTPPVISDQEIVGVAWTMMTKKYDSSRPSPPGTTIPGQNRHFQYDYRFSSTGAPPEAPGTTLPAGVELVVSNNNGSTWYGQRGSPVAIPQLLRDPGWSVPFSAIPPPPASPQRVRLPVTAGKTTLKYQAFIRMAAPPLSTTSSILLDSPILDDVTIYFTTGRAQFLDWVIL